MGFRNTRNEQRATELLKDKRAYRQTLIHGREEVEAKITHVEQDIQDLQGVANGN